MSWLLPFIVSKNKKSDNWSAKLAAHPFSLSFQPPSTTIEKPVYRHVKLSVKLEHAELTKKACFCPNRKNTSQGTHGGEHGQKDRK